MTVKRSGKAAKFHSFSALHFFVHKGRITEPYMLISLKKDPTMGILGILCTDNAIYFFENVKLSCCRPSDHAGNLSHDAEHWCVHFCHSSAGQSNRSCLYMTQRVQYACVKQCIICIYTGTAERIRCV